MPKCNQRCPRTGYTRLIGGGALGLALMMTTSLSMAQENPVDVGRGDDQLFSARVLTTGLSNPWEITWGPDDMIRY